MKVLTVETLDGVAVLGYAGLGLTPNGTEPSSWLSAILRGRGGISLEQSLGLISAVANRELPQFLPDVHGVNTIVAPAFIKGRGPQLFTIDNLFDRVSGQFGYRFVHHLMSHPTSPPARIGLAGSGAGFLRKCLATWERPLLRLVRDHDNGKVSEYAVADRLAQLNYRAHLGVSDRSVGPRSVVVWRRRPDARRQPPTGSAFQFYSMTDREGQDVDIPSIANGMDVQAIAGVLMKMLMPKIGSGTLELTPAEQAEEDRLMSELPDGPDETLH